MKIQPDNPVPIVDSLIARSNEWHSSNWDIPSSSEQYIEQNGVADYIRATSMDPTTTVGVVPNTEVTEPSTKQVEPPVEATPTSRQTPVPRVSADGKEGVLYSSSKEKPALP